VDVNDLITLLVFVLVLCVIYWVTGKIAMEPMVRNIIMIIIAIVAVVWLLRNYIPGVL
jgi:hypothetical protein